MKRIGLTQRVENASNYEERRDCLDQRWAPLLQGVGIFPLPLANKINDVEAYLDSLNIEGIVLTGGNDLSEDPDAANPAPERDRFERLTLDYAQLHSLPVLGVCRGMQMMGDYFGGTLSKTSEHVARRHTVSLCPPTFLSWPSSFEVNSFHNHGFKQTEIGSAMEIISMANDNTVEAFVHRDLPQYGIMWHPERETTPTAEDLDLLRKVFGV
jgi:gamma-glutamyl-gamma-aminobutyrate hydrolase PuuD